jgi:hypothetical protein
MKVGDLAVIRPDWRYGDWSTYDCTTHQLAQMAAGKQIYYVSSTRKTISERDLLGTLCEILFVRENYQRHVVWIHLIAHNKFTDVWEDALIPLQPQ